MIGPVSNGRLRLEDGGVTYPGVVADKSGTRFPMREKGSVMILVGPVVARPVDKVMQAGAIHRMIGRPDPDKAGDVAEFADMAVGNVAVALAIRVISQMTVQNA